jgi:Tol biopolymer transport system component
MFRSNRNGNVEFYQRSAAGGGNERLVLSGEAYRAGQIPSTNLVPTDWSPDGRQVLFSVSSPVYGNDLWLLPLGEEGKTCDALFVDNSSARAIIGEWWAVNSVMGQLGRRP